MQVEMKMQPNNYVDSICINMNYAINNSMALYDKNKKESLLLIESIRKYLSEVNEDLTLLEVILQNQAEYTDVSETSTALKFKRAKLTKIRRRYKKLIPEYHAVNLPTL